MSETDFKTFIVKLCTGYGGSLVGCGEHVFDVLIANECINKEKLLTLTRSDLDKMDLELAQKAGLLKWINNYNEYQHSLKYGNNSKQPPWWFKPVYAPNYEECKSIVSKKYDNLYKEFKEKYPGKHSVWTLTTIDAFKLRFLLGDIAWVSVSTKDNNVANVSIPMDKLTPDVMNIINGFSSMRST